MGEYSYTALGKDGHKESAVVQAPTIEAAGHILKDQGLLPLEIKEKGGNSFSNALRNITTVSLAEKITFISNLSVMIKAGISVPKCLRILSSQTTNFRFKNVLTDVSAQVESGKSLGEALEKHANVFSNIFVSMVKVGEISGGLEKSLEYLTVQLQREADLKSKTKGAMIYPSVIVGAMVIIGVVMSIFVLPKLTSIFKEFGSDLPPQTRLVMAFADFMQAHAVIVLGGLIALVAGFISFLKTAAGQRAADAFLLRFPIINPIVKKINLARFARVLSSLLKSGVPIVQSLEVSSDSIGNAFYRELVARAGSEVKLGKSLTQTLGTNPTLFPPLVVQMLMVGEESGTTQEILEQLAIHYEEEVDDTMRNLSSIIEPLLLLTIGGVVGFLAFALIGPIYNLGNSIK